MRAIDGFLTTSSRIKGTYIRIRATDSSCCFQSFPVALIYQLSAGFEQIFLPVNMNSKPDKIIDEHSEAEEYGQNIEEETGNGSIASSNTVNKSIRVDCTSQGLLNHDAKGFILSRIEESFHQSFQTPKKGKHPNESGDPAFLFVGKFCWCNLVLN
jgi:hypothetical protein